MSSYIPPSGYSETQVVAAIDKVGRTLAKGYAFGSFAPADIAQEVAVYCAELLAKGKYDPSRPLEGYFMTHARRRLTNLRRDHFRRSDPPCARCDSGNPCGSGQVFCKRYAVWHSRQEAKSALASNADPGTPVANVALLPGQSSVVEGAAEAGELEQVIDTHLPVELRQDFLLLKGGEPIPKQRRELVKAAVLAALGRAGLTLADFGMAQPEGDDS